MSNANGNGDYPVFWLMADERASIETLYRAFSDKNPDLLDQALVPDWQNIPLHSGAKPGREGIKPVIEVFMTAFPDPHINILEIIGASGQAAVQAEITGTYKGEWLGVAANAEAFSHSIARFPPSRGRQDHPYLAPRGLVRLACEGVCFAVSE